MVYMNSNVDTLQKLVLSRKGAFEGDAIAIECDGRQITFDEFDEITDVIAANLVEAGCMPGASVVVRMERSIEMVFAMFGVMKTGAAFVPVVLSVPETRFESILKSLGDPLVIDDKSYSKFAYDAEDFPTGDALSTKTYNLKPITYFFTGLLTFLPVFA